MNTASVIGKRIARVRKATPREMQLCDWVGDTPPVVFVLDNGLILIASTDEELNHPGCALILDTLTQEIIRPEEVKS
jgi:hypothetical protein